LGEWGTPIPDINGEMTEEQQANIFTNLSEINEATILKP
jgi:hypothetical protein